MSYSANYFDEIETGSIRSAQKVVPTVLRLVHPSSVVDVGCGRGAWLRVFQDYGVADVLGIDGGDIESSSLLIEPAHFQSRDLVHDATLASRQFDLAMCLEVAEHLPGDVAPSLVRRLTQLSSIILFSAAIPGQGGVDHVNEQWPNYWENLFSQLGLQGN
jgi:2-polyprenyl-3-methyl-5-hydroxy-6-metoxy-1,4-benzoquinol methylase